MEKLIFVVDDNDANLSMAASSLDETYEVLTMLSAKRMFNVLEKRKADLILLDNEMPEMTGLEAIIKLKENPQYKDIPVLFLTGYSDEKLLSEFKNAGALDVIMKPIVPSMLLDCVRKYV